MEKDFGKTSTGMQANVEALLSYLLGFITGIIFYLIEKENKLVRFHAMQSIIIFGSLFVLQIILAFIPLLGGILQSLVGLVSVILWVVLMIKAYQGDYFKVPIAGDMAEKQI
jgi:uncharacterized membrane protein